MGKEESEPFGTDKEMWEKGKEVYEILHAWATSGTQLVYSAGIYGFDVEGKIKSIREPDDDTWGIFDVSFLFFSKTREITAFVQMSPRMKILRQPSGEFYAVEFGPDGVGACTLRSAKRRKPQPDDLRRVTAQLTSWVERKMKVWVYLDLGFTALASVCDIEAVNDLSFALTEEGSSRAYFAVPEFSSRASIEDLEGNVMVRLTSEDLKTELLISETSIGKEDLMARMISNMVH